jgi:hypothetical protein
MAGSLPRPRTSQRRRASVAAVIRQGVAKIVQGQPGAGDGSGAVAICRSLLVARDGITTGLPLIPSRALSPRRD